MARYLIHTSKQRQWYVDEILIPSMVRQGIDSHSIYRYIDNKEEGNLVACMRAFEIVDRFNDFDGITWHLQDDVAISKAFKQYTEVEYESDIVCAFCPTELGKRKSYPIGHVDPENMWYSFQCIGIRNIIASGCAKWFFTDGQRDPRVAIFVSRSLGDDEVFKHYCTNVCSGLKVLNMIPNLVEHIDFMIGGSTAAKGMPQRRAMYLKDGTEIVQKLMEELNNVQKAKGKD